MVVLLAAIGWFYLWTAYPDRNVEILGKGWRGYYNLLTNGLAKGHLYMDLPDDPVLAASKDPGDPAQRNGHGLHDASYYHGHFYLYFGVTPALLTFLPVKLLTGMDLQGEFVTVSFCWLGLLASAWIFLDVRRRHFPAVPSWLALLAVAALGLCNMVPLLLRRASIWELPIACAYGLFMLGLAFLLRSGRGKHPLVWLSLASATIALCVGARPNYVVGCLLLFVPLWNASRAVGGLTSALRSASWRKLAAAALIPAGLVGIGLGLYNYERFGKFSEFGIRYQMNSENQGLIKHFDWAFPPYGLHLYWLSPAHWSPYFPFISVILPPPMPPGVFSIEDVYGLIPNIPFVLAALGLLALACGSVRRRRPELSGFVAACLVGVGLISLLTASFGAYANRYEVDFAPGAVLLACLGLMWITEARWYHGWRKRGVAVLLVMAFAVSVVFSVGASIRHNELLRDTHPALYQKLIHAGNRLPALMESAAQAHYGPVEMKIVFPTPKPDTIEPLVVTGHSFLADYLVIHYEQPGHLSFGLVHTSRNTTFGASTAVTVGVPHTVRVEMGSLYPPAGHPYFDAFDRITARQQQSTVRVTVDGKVALEARREFYDSVSWDPRIGHSGPGMAFTSNFSGKILSTTRIVALPSSSVAKTRHGPLRLRLLLPPFATQGPDPLVSSGIAGRADVVFVRYVDKDHVAFGFDHWSRGGPETAPIGIDYAVEHTVEIDYGTLHDSGIALTETDPERKAKGWVKLDGKTVLEGDLFFWPSDADTIEAATNPMQASSAGPTFTGRIDQVDFVGNQ